MIEQGDTTITTLDFLKLLKEVPPEIDPIINEFLYSNTANMIAADPGVGKSTVAVQIAVSLACGIPLFGKLLVPRPYKVYYLAMETEPLELHTQLHSMQMAINLSSDEIGRLLTENLAWDDSSIGINLLNLEDVGALATKVEARFIPDILIIDPMYLCVSGDFKDGRVSSQFVRSLRALKKRWKCALILLHHTHREKHTADGKVIAESNPFYGSRWIEAFVHVAWYLKKRDSEHQGVIFLNRKDRLKSCLSQITLQYHPESWSCSMEADDKSDFLVALLDLLRRVRQSTKQTDFQQVKATIGCSDITLRRLMRHPHVAEQVDFVREHGKRTIWRIR